MWCHWVRLSPLPVAEATPSDACLPPLNQEPVQAKILIVMNPSLIQSHLANAYMDELKRRPRPR